MKKTFVVGVLWIICGFLNWGMTLGRFTDLYPEFNQVPIAAFMAAAGIPGIVPATVFGYGHWCVVPLTRQQSWEAFHKKFPDLSYSDFASEY